VEKRDEQFKLNKRKTGRVVEIIFNLSYETKSVHVIEIVFEK
jgi:hypothetical protein